MLLLVLCVFILLVFIAALSSHLLFLFFLLRLSLMDRFWISYLDIVKQKPLGIHSTVLVEAD